MNRILLGMSGGVDSSAAAALLQQQGYTVTGATFALWKPANETGKSEIADAKAVCDKLGIPHIVLDFRQPFLETVVQNFVREYSCGHTPSPCIVCNRLIKFGLFYETAKQLGYDGIATGHYARICQKDGDYRLQMGVNRAKDQSYFLYGIPHEHLGQVLFPLGEMSKPEVRALAEQRELPVAHKGDSQEICFVSGSYADFLQTFTGEQPQPGDFVDTSGRTLGRHKGLWRYTVGQRKGLGMAFGKPMFVQRLEPETNRVVLAEDAETYTDVVTLNELRWQVGAPPTAPFAADVKIRSRAPLARATVIPDGSRAVVRFAQPQRAPAPGQSAVFYEGDLVIGGGILSD